MAVMFFNGGKLRIKLINSQGIAMAGYKVKSKFGSNQYTSGKFIAYKHEHISVSDINGYVEFSNQSDSAINIGTFFNYIPLSFTAYSLHDYYMFYIDVSVETSIGVMRKSWALNWKAYIQASYAQKPLDPTSAEFVKTFVISGDPTEIEGTIDDGSVFPDPIKPPFYDPNDPTATIPSVDPDDPNDGVIGNPPIISEIPSAVNTNFIAMFHLKGVGGSISQDGVIYKVYLKSYLKDTTPDNNWNSITNLLTSTVVDGLPNLSDALVLNDTNIPITSLPISYDSSTGHMIYRVVISVNKLSDNTEVNKYVDFWFDTSVLPLNGVNVTKRYIVNLSDLISSGKVDANDVDPTEEKPAVPIFIEPINGIEYFSQISMDSAPTSEKNLVRVKDIKQLTETSVKSPDQSIKYMRKISYEDYLALPVKDPNTRYVIIDAPGVEEGIPMLITPDYANQETINRITSNNGEWTVQETGYIKCYIEYNNSASSGWIWFSILVNNARVSGNSLNYPINSVRYQSEPIPVTKGDVVSISFNKSSEATIPIDSINLSCYFIPLKLTAIQPPVISDENFGNYLDRVNYDTRVDLYTQANPTLPYTQNIDYDGWCRIQVSLGANSAVSIVAYPKSLSLDGSTIARFNGVAESEQYFKMIPVRNGDKLEIFRITGTVLGLVISKYSSVFVAASAPIVTTRPKTYSTTEKQTDDVWYNGKPIYRKVYTGTFAKSTGTSSVNVLLESIPTFDQFVTVGGHVTVPSSNRNSRNIPYIGGDYQSTTFNFYSVYYNGAQKNLWFVHRDADSEDGTVDGSYVVWVEYTKTTD